MTDVLRVHLNAHFAAHEELKDDRRYSGLFKRTQKRKDPPKENDDAGPSSGRAPPPPPPPCHSPSLGPSFPHIPESQYDPSHTILALRILHKSMQLLPILLPCEGLWMLLTLLTLLLLIYLMYLHYPITTLCSPAHVLTLALIPIRPRSPK
ncbi:hypothetical protein F5050DRAFT_1811454 [Lentinula boryana]|uniref:Uncharacterized protein n=1 Tax=Lentinula boryana TaxID=40481 RepID=A0ABQ8Q439_9AGAR|nr:hypothetical protein F5050DRAFT_1811454 [Lentinula boryana]